MVFILVFAKPIYWFHEVLENPVTDSCPWLPVRDAASLIHQHPITLRRRLARHAVRTPDGVVAEVDGMFARKLGNTWRVRLGRWAELEPR